MPARWNVPHLNIAIFGSDGRATRKIAWITTRSGGVYCGISNTIGVTSKVSYHASGDLYTGFVGTRPGLPPRVRTTVTPINEVRGLLPFYNGGIGWHEYLPDFPFDRVDEAVYVDVRRTGGVSFSLGLLNPQDSTRLADQDVRTAFQDAHVHIIARTQPWLVIWTHA